MQQALHVFFVVPEVVPPSGRHAQPGQQHGGRFAVTQRQDMHLSAMVAGQQARGQAHATDGFDVAVAMDARMDEAYAARYRWGGGRWQVLQAPALYTLPALNAAWSGASAPGLVAGSALAVFGARLSLPAGWQRIDHEQNRAAALLRLAHRAAHSSEGVDPADALPLYLRDKVALTTAERAAAKAPTPVDGSLP